MHILLVEFELYIPGCHSLKEKRSVVKPLLNEIRRDYNVSAAEVGKHDEWQLAHLAVVMVGPMKPPLEKTERELADLIEKNHAARLSGMNSQWL